MTEKSSPSAHSATAEPVDDIAEISSAELDRLEITAHPHVSYHWNGYRYSNSSDAVAAAKRASR